MDWLRYKYLDARAVNECESREGKGECIPKDDCVGISTEGLCPNDPSDVQCCLVRTCEVDAGSGYCRSEQNNGCEDGEFFPGTGPPWPCVGPNDIQCCVKSTAMETATKSSNRSNSTGSSSTDSSESASESNSETTSTTATPSTSSSSPTPPPQTVTLTPTPSPTPFTEPKSGGLTSGQRGGIGVGVAAGAIMIILAVVWLFLRRRRQQKKPDHPEIAEAPAGEKPLPKPPMGKYDNADAELLGTPVSPSGDHGAFRDEKPPPVYPGSSAAPAELDPNSNAPVELPASEVSPASK